MNTVPLIITPCYLLYIRFADFGFHTLSIRAISLLAVIVSQFMYLTRIHCRRYPAAVLQRYDQILHCQLHLRMRSCAFTPLDRDDVRGYAQ